MSIATVFTAVVGALSSPVANATGNILTAANTGMNIAELNKLKKIQTGINCANARLTCIDRGQNDLISQIDEFVDAIDDVVDFPQANVQPGQPQPVTPAPAAEVTTAPVSAPAPADEMAKMWAAINRLAAGGAVAPAPTAAPATPVAEAPVTPTPAAAPAATPTAAPAPAAVVNVGTAAAPTAAPTAAPAEEYVTKAELIAAIEGNNTTLLAGVKDLILGKVDDAAGESAPAPTGKPKK